MISTTAFLSITVLQGVQPLTPQSRIDTSLAPPAVHQYGVRLRMGQSVMLSVVQRGIDVIVELLDPRDTIIGIVDSPNGRDGPEPVEIFASRAGLYTLRVKPFDNREPTGRYTLAIDAWRDAGATRRLLARRQQARDSAAAWLRAHSVPLTPSGPSLDSLARRAAVIGIGEATHGSREFGDVRLLLTRYLVERHGYRLVAIEASASRLGWLDRVLRGERPGSDSLAAMLEWGWIGRRALRELVGWIGQWNASHRGDPVFLVGVDPQDAELARRDLRAFLTRAYPSSLDRYAAVERELATADSQTLVFGDSRVDSSARRFLEGLVSRTASDAPLLARMDDSAMVSAGITAARQMLQFADFNAGASDPWMRSRDWYMAANLLAALSRTDAARAVLWAHNAHVAAPPDRSPRARPTGSWLRAALGCGYVALAVTFGAGSFVAQNPNDPENDLAINTLPPAAAETIEGLIRDNAAGPTVTLWDCNRRAAGAPAWLQAPQRMHWVGALFRPGTNPSEAYQPVRLLHDFDGIVFIPEVSADELPNDRPRIPARP